MSAAVKYLFERSFETQRGASSAKMQFDSFDEDHRFRAADLAAAREAAFAEGRMAGLAEAQSGIESAAAAALEHLAASMEALSAENVAGEFAGDLSDSGETIRLTDAMGNLVDEVRYRPGGNWPQLAAGGGGSGSGSALIFTPATVDSAGGAGMVAASLLPGERSAVTVPTRFWMSSM